MDGKHYGNETKRRVVDLFGCDLTTARDWCHAAGAPVRVGRPRQGAPVASELAAAEAAQARVRGRPQGLRRGGAPEGGGRRARFPSA